MSTFYLFPKTVHNLLCYNLVNIYKKNVEEKIFTTNRQLGDLQSSNRLHKIKNTNYSYFADLLIVYGKNLPMYIYIFFLYSPT